MAEGVLIKIDADDSKYDSKLNNLEKKAKDSAIKAQKAVEEANEAIKKALEETDDKVKASADNTVKEAVRAAKEAEAEAKRAADAVAKHNSETMKSSADIVAGVNKGVKTLATAGAAAGAAVLGIGVDYNMQMEQYNAGFATMLGNAERAGELMDDIKGFAGTTPFELTDLADASTTLLAFGENVEELMPDLKMLGDISLGNKDKFKSLALVFGQVQSQGKLMGQDLLQMINSGFNPLQVISEKTGKSMATLKDEMSKGAISFDMVADAMKTATSEGGQFFNAMESQSETASGQISTLKDNVTAFFGKLSEGVSESLTEEILPEAIEMVDWLNEKLDDGSLEKWLKNGATAAATFGGALGALNIALIINDLANLKKGTEAYTAATKLGTAAQKLHNAELLKNPYTIVAVALAALVAGVAAYAATHESASEKIANANKEVEKSINDLDKSYKDSIKAIDDKRDAEIAEAEQVTHLKDRLYELEDQIKSGTLTDEEAEVAKANFNKTASQLEGIIPGITSKLYNETGAIDVQRNSVDLLTDAYYRLAKAKAYANAYQAKLEEIAKARIDAQEELDKANQNNETALIAAGQAKLHNEQVSDNPRNVRDMIESATGISQLKYDNAIKNAEAAQKNVKTVQDKIDNYTAKEEKYANDYADYMSEVTSIELEMEKLLGTTNKPITSGGISSPGVGSSSTGSSSSGGSGTSSKTSDSAVKKLFDDLNHQYKLGEITHKEYLDELERLNNAYYKEGTTEHNKYAEEIYAGRKQLEDESLRMQEEARDEELSILKYKLAVGEVSEFEYYKQLAGYRDKYFDETSEEYRQLTQEIKQWLDAQAQETIDKWQSIIDELKDKQANLKDAFAIDKKAIGSVTFHDGDSTEKITTLVDTTYDNAQLEKYNKLLKQYKERVGGTMDDFIVGQLQGLNTSDGIAYLELLLTKSEEEFKTYMDGIRYNDELAAENAELLMENEFANIKQMYENELGELPDDFFAIGEDSADMFGQGFLKEFELMWKNMEQQIVSSLNSLPQMGLMSIYAREAAEVGPSQQINDNRSYTFNVPGNTPRQVFETEKQSQIYSWHTGIADIYNK